MTNKNNYGRRKKYSIRRLKESSVRQEFKKKISSKLKQMSKYAFIEEEWAQIGKASVNASGKWLMELKATNKNQRKKRKLWEDTLDDIEYNFRTKEIRNFYEEVKESRSLYSAETTYYRNENGTLTGDMEEKLNIWAEYLEKLLEGNDTPTEEEMKQTIRLTKNNKGGGEN
ncbi:hypothetical protein ILUMI_19850 [Ignelater luminosus]|uniref:Uncharacterized protein n=1 Tax=Ignelater luminosus TaxID=2038154 RepID=A0A8K0G569_IGNLU|nr:hypothetical protein ILUMI_19850 [Ignelater luminosus]